MVIAVAAFGLALHPDQQRVAAGIGSAAPTPRRASAAEAFVSAELDWASRGDLSRDLTDEFGRLVATAAAPIDDVRGTAAYRLHALSVMARRVPRLGLDRPPARGRLHEGHDHGQR